MQLINIFSAILAFFVYAAIAVPVPQNHWLIDAIHPPIPRVRPPVRPPPRTNNVEIQDLSYMNLAKPPYSRPPEKPEDIYHAAPFHYAPGWEPASKMPATDFRPTRKFGPKPNAYSDFMESNMKAAAQGLGGDKENLYGASSSKSPVDGISQEIKDALFGTSPWYSFRPPPSAKEKEALGKKIPNSPKGAPKSKEEESQHLKDIGANVQTESSGRVQQEEGVGKSSSSSSTPVKEQEDQALQEHSSSGKTPAKEQTGQAVQEHSSSGKTPDKEQAGLADQAVEENSSSSKTPIKDQKDQAAEEYSSSSKTPIKDQKDRAVEENSSSGKTPIKEQEDQEAEEGSSSSNTHVKGQEDEVVEKSFSSSPPVTEQEDGAAKKTRPASEENNDEEEDGRSSEAYAEEVDNEQEDSRSSELHPDENNDEVEDSRSSEPSLDESNGDEDDSRSSEAYSEEVNYEEDDSRRFEPSLDEEEADYRSSEAYSEETNYDDEEDSRSSEAYSEEMNPEEEDSRSTEPPSDNAAPAKKVTPADLASSSANAPSTPGHSNLKPIKLLLKRAVKFVTDRKHGVTYKLAKVYLPDFPEAITNQPHFIGAKYRGNPIRRKYQFRRQNKDGSFLYWRPKKWNHRERHIIVYPFEEGVQARSILQVRDEGFAAPTWSNTADTSYPADEYEEDFREDEDDIIEDIEYYPEDLASLYDVSNSTSSPNLETSNSNTTTPLILPRSVAHPSL